jgi:AraC-like DNA-binding protein
VYVPADEARRLSYRDEMLVGMYRERASRIPGAVVWQRSPLPADSTTRVLPDGCMDLIWTAGTLHIAGPDTAARLARSPSGASFVALRFAPGTGPAIFGVPAHELRDQQAPLHDLWPAWEVRRLTERLDEAPDRAAVLEEFAARRLAAVEPPAPAVGAVVALIRAGAPVGDIAGRLALSERQLHRRCLVAFGYGPKTLARILRLDRALSLARAGTPFATVAATVGYADQPHLAREVKALAGVPLGTLLG